MRHDVAHRARRTAAPAERRQLERKRGARIWFTVDEHTRTVHVLAVHTHRPNATE